LHWVLLPTKTHNTTLLFGSIILKHCRHFDYWNHPLNMSMCVCYLDSHEAVLCCYLVIHIENVLRSLPLFHFHLWPIYWLLLIVGRLLAWQERLLLHGRSYVRHSIFHFICSGLWN
jgi:hypothetical protein